MIQKTLNEVSQTAAKSKLSLGTIFALWSASAGMSAIMDTLNAEHEVSETRLTGAAMLIGAEINGVIEDAAAEAGEPHAKLTGEFSPQR